MHDVLADRVADDPPPFPVSSQDITRRLSGGRAVEMTEGAPPASMGHPANATGKVRVHDDAAANHIAAALSADALAVGNDVVMRRPLSTDTSRDSALLAHEMRHVASYTGPGGSAGRVQCAVTVDDVTVEMIGKPFTLLADYGAPPDVLRKGTQVVVSDWNGSGRDAKVSATRPDGSLFELMVRKLDLEPVLGLAPGTRAFRVGLGGQRKAVQSAQATATNAKVEADTWRAKQVQYKSKPEAWAAGMGRLDAELNRAEQVLAGKERVLSSMLVQETLYNALDRMIVKWIDHYHSVFKPKDKLDPNLVKSMMFQESRFGTSGKHLVKPPYSWASADTHPIKSRFNVMQSIDSWGPQQLIMIKEMAPAIFSKFGLGELEKKMAAERMSGPDFAAWEGGKFETAIREFLTHRDAAGKNLMGHRGVDLFEDYEFWVRTAIRWLYEKLQHLPQNKRTWSEAIRAFNGSGPDAERYRSEVVRRVTGSGDVVVGTR